MIKKYKDVPCNTCGGFGYLVYSTPNSYASRWCTKCGGSGNISVPATNGDIIRNCNNSELALVRENLRTWAIYSGGDNNRLLDSSPEDFELWLNKEADEIDMRTIFNFERCR